MIGEKRKPHYSSTVEMSVKSKDERLLSQLFSRIRPLYTI